VWSAVIGRMMRRLNYRACYRWTGWMGFWSRGLGWLLGRKALHPYNDEHVRCGYGLECRTPYECCVGLRFSGSAYVGLKFVV